MILRGLGIGTIAVAMLSACGPAQPKPRPTFAIPAEDAAEAPLPGTTLDNHRMYLETGLDDYLKGVKKNPDAFTPEQVTGHVRRTLKENQLLFYWPLVSIELDALGKLSAKAPPSFSRAHPKWLSKGPGRWLLGQHSASRTSGFSFPGFKNLIRGTDLGISVSFGDKTLIYFGDTGGRRSPKRCKRQNKFRCDDPIGVSFDTDFDDGTDLYIVTERALEEWGFLPLVIPGVHLSASGKAATFGTYNTPTGAAVVPTTPLNDVGPSVVVWFGTFSRPPAPRQGASACWAGCSANGIHFENCYGNTSGRPVAFSRRKFIQVSPVPVTKEDIVRVCAGGAGGPLCSLPDWRTSKGGVLLFGAGGKYRCSSLYMAYIPLEQLGSVHDRVPFVYYYDGGGWSLEERDAEPVIGIDERNCVNLQSDKAPVWCYAQGGKCVRLGGQVNAFGEFSVKLVRDKEGGDAHLVMLSNHIKAPVLYRTASLANPDRWSPHIKTYSPGYGPYIIDKSIRIEDGKLYLHHTISTWGGPKGKTPYGVYTMPLRIMVDGEPVPPPWPPE